MSDILRLAYRRAFTAGDPSLLQISFDPALLDRYRGAPGFQLIRTETAGRIRKQGGWSIDLGIAEDGSVHASWKAIVEYLPEDEREHWAMHAIALAVSDNFVRMQMAPASCFDDGELRSWE